MVLLKCSTIEHELSDKQTHPRSPSIFSFEKARGPVVKVETNPEF